jgi:GTP-dependent phosphoenolpyruvate carboxykinase
VDEPWKVDPPNEATFWKKMQKNLVDGTLDKEESEALANNRYLFEVIIRNYAEEIAGKFKINTFKKTFMKKKTIYIVIFVIAIVGNTFISTPIRTDKQTHVSLSIIEAKADDTGENELPDPGDDIIIHSPSPWSLSAIIDYLFGE